MPIYEYICKSCGAGFELLIPARDRDNPKIRCPECDSSEIARKLSHVARAYCEDSGSSGSCPTCGGGSCPIY